jgi:hypothetical protein
VVSAALNATTKGGFQKAILVAEDAKGKAATIPSSQTRSPFTVLTNARWTTPDMLAEDLAKVLQRADPHSELAVMTPAGTFVIERTVIDLKSPGVILICGPLEKYEECDARTTTESGEHVTPCHKQKGHTGEHEGYCLGSRAVWNNK